MRPSPADTRPTASWSPPSPPALQCVPATAPLPSACVARLGQRQPALLCRPARSSRQHARQPGQIWGGVVANQGNVQFSRGDAQSGFYFARRRPVPHRLPRREQHAHRRQRRRLLASACLAGIRQPEHRRQLLCHALRQQRERLHARHGRLLQPAGLLPGQRALHLGRPLRDQLALQHRRRARRAGIPGRHARRCGRWPRRQGASRPARTIPCSRT